MRTINAKDMTHKTGVTVLVYGESGVGKTSLLGMIEGATLVVDLEAGTIPLAGKENIDILTIDSGLDDFKNVFDEVVLEGPKYANIAFDSFTELQTAMLVKLGKSGSGLPSLKDYGLVNFKMREYARRLRDLRDKGINVIVTALEMIVETEHDDEVVETKLFPMMSKKLAPEICGLFDVVARMTVSSKEGHVGERFLVLEGNDTMVAKSRYGGPAFLPASEFNEFIKKCRAGTAGKVEPTPKATKKA